MAELISLSFAGLFLAGMFAFLVVGLRKRRRYVWFRLVDEKTKAPLAGAKVFGVRYAGTHAAVPTMDGHIAFVPTMGGGHERRKLLGHLDAEGRFQRVVGFREYAAFWIEAPGVTAGLIGVDSVAEYARFPKEPYVCTVTHGGMIAPPKKRSPISMGLEPGEMVTRREGYTNSYEKPEQHDTVIAYPTLEAAKRHAHGGGFDRYWKVEGIFLADFQDGFHLKVESVRRAE